MTYDQKICYETQRSRLRFKLIAMIKHFWSIFFHVHVSQDQLI